MNRPLVGEHNGENGAHGGWFHDQTEHLRQINTGSLRETVEDPTRLISIQGAIRLQFVSKNPFTYNHISTCGTWNKVPGIISAQGSELLLYGEVPIVISAGPHDMSARLVMELRHAGSTDRRAGKNRVFLQLSLSDH
ncbi:hypothetical protein IHE45_09G057300 [Dioscorea alata]|uniref:Uncharacterized protein n=1 Tax=Dioscorea alata TaxID=55571 RepID=A0ACB7VFJ6_DIOAL|nr:hypothetical protein IHE45_09G057300 [Dioscorea alata]